VQVLNEINERVYIGDKPDVIKQVSENKDKYIHELRVTNIDGYD